MPRPLRITLYVLAGLLAVVLLVVALAPLWLEPIVHDRLEAAVAERSDGQYVLDVGDVDLSLIGGRVALANTTLRLTDSTRRRSTAASLTGGLLVEGEVEEAAVRGIRWWPLLTDRRLAFDSLLLERPRLRVTDGRSAGDGATDNDSAGRRDKAGTNASGGSALPSGGIRIGGIRLADADVAYGYGLDSAAQTIDLDGLDVFIADIRVDSLRGGTRLLERFGYARASVGGLRYELGDGLHVLRFAEAHFDTRGARLTLDSLRVRPRLPGFSLDAAVDPDVDVPAGSPAALAMDADELALEGIDLRALLQDGAVRARKLSLDTATAEVYRSAGASATSGAEAPAREISIDSVDLAGVALVLRSADPLTRLEVPRAELLLTDLSLGTDADTARIFGFAEGRLRLRDGLRYRPSTDGSVRFEKADFDLNTSAAEVVGFRYGPPLANGGEPNGPLTIAAERIGGTGVSLRELFWEGSLDADSIAVDGLVIEAITDLRDGPIERSAQDLLLVQLQSLRLPMALDRIDVDDASVRFRRIDADTDVTLRWDDTYASFYHVGTRAAYAKTHPKAEVDIRTVFQDMLPVTVDVSWPNAAGVPYRLSAETEALDDLTRVNAFTEPLGKIKVEGGRLDRLAFSWTSTNTEGEGRLQATYSGFRVNLLDGSGDDKDVVSLLANVAAVQEDSDGRSARMTVTREPELGMFAHWWALIREGLRQVALNDLGEGVTQ